jgi:Holliday junction resolvase RusA-like endonuclease
VKIVVYGNPAPQGSKRFMGVHGGRGVMIESSKAVKPWREAVKYAARDQNATMEPFDGPLIVRMVFTVPKPKSAPKRRTWPCRKPDLSKLIRSTEDALTDAGIWTDDARIVQYERTAKVYPNEDPEALNTPGAVIEIRSMEVERIEDGRLDFSAAR